MEAARLTRNQKAVFEVLSAAGAPLTAYALLDALRDHGFRAPLQVYRALDKLIAAGLIHRIESLNAFVACASPLCHGRGAAVFMLCDACGTVEEFSDAAVATCLDRVCASRGFSSTKRTVELHGRCATCCGVTEH